MEEETTTPEEIADFEKHVKQQAKRRLTNYNAGLEMMTEDKYLEQVAMLNTQQRKIFDDFIERNVIFEI